MVDLPSEERSAPRRPAQPWLLSVAFGVLTSLATSAMADEAVSTPNGATSAAPAPDNSAPTTVASNIATPKGPTGHAVDSGLLPPFEWGARAGFSEAYTSNANGVSGQNRPDYISTLSLNAYMHEHSRRVVFDLNYSFGADFYARGSTPTQISNNLQAVGSVEAIEDYLTINAKAFAAPIVTSNIGIVTAGNRTVPNGFRNSFGYYGEPDLKFRLGDFATSETTATYGATYFTNPAGTVPIAIPGLPGPQDTTERAATQTFASGDDFNRFSWTLVGAWSELDRKQGLLSEKAGVANPRYAINHEISLIATVGYDAISNTTALTRNVSGLVAMGGFALTFGEEFSALVEAGRKYNDASYLGNLRYNLNPTASLVASIDDSVSTPEGQLLNSLTGLVSANGSLTSNDNLLGNGNSASLGGFSADSFGNLTFDQNVSRFRSVQLSFLEDFDRIHGALSLFGYRRTILSGVFLGPPTTDSWGGSLRVSRDFTRLLVGEIGTSYTVNQELGGIARTLNVNGELNYLWTREMQLYLRGDYLDRQSSEALKLLSPFTGSVTDYRITLGVSRTL